MIPDFTKFLNKDIEDLSQLGTPEHMASFHDIWEGDYYKKRKLVTWLLANEGHLYSITIQLFWKFPDKVDLNFTVTHFYIRI